jgi:PhnB protein
VRACGDRNQLEPTGRGLNLDLRHNHGMADSIETYRTLTPYLVVADADAEIRFLKAAFGATEASCQRNPDHTVMHAELKVGNSLLMLGQAGGDWKVLTAALYVWIPDVDAAYARALKAGCCPREAESDKARRTAGAGRVILLNADLAGSHSGGTPRQGEMNLLGPPGTNHH